MEGKAAPILFAMAMIIVQLSSIHCGFQTDFLVTTPSDWGWLLAPFRLREDPERWIHLGFLPCRSEVAKGALLSNGQHPCECSC